MYNNYNMNPMMQQQYQQMQSMQQQMPYQMMNAQHQQGGFNQQKNNNNNQGQMSQGRYKTQICRHFNNGNCQLGASCHFAHGTQELRQANDPLPENIPSLQIPKMNYNNQKTVRCKYFDGGLCRNQQNCTFAHGEQERRNVQVQGGNNVNMQQQQMGNNQQDQSFLQNQVLIIILSNLQKVFADNQQVLKELDNAIALANINKSDEVTKIITQIMNSPERTEQETKSYDTIYQNAQIYFHSMINQQSGNGLQQNMMGQNNQQQQQ
ncbi:hypothetical protein PPERSA_09129 [Pseudocohnilembus persalinus]|uniref:C3H1-type domain-containing protein n=1 Tax=Pseudocohnilembus persalinus TaxID=266149 RepID=A0A0V0QWU7_PSEPJ|nr:hypothetical protein PPERSA_09129 [Pseudocohnilembus persalinus]|eukprot:KRX06727.1 hypothetical protein PPERSA_09129 [Pseudocohnilembus persalinus]